MSERKRNPKIVAAAERLKVLFEAQGKEKTVAEQAAVTLQAVSVATIIDQFSRSLVFNPGEAPSGAHLLGVSLLLAKWARDSESQGSGESFKERARAVLENAFVIYDFNEQLHGELTEEERQEIVESLYGPITKAVVDPNQN